MKMFWALIGLLVLGTVALVASGVLSNDKPAEAPSTVQRAASIPPSSPTATPRAAESDKAAAPAPLVASTPSAPQVSPEVAAAPVATRTQNAPSDAPQDQTPAAATPAATPPAPVAAAPTPLPVEAPAPATKQPEPATSPAPTTDAQPAPVKSPEEPENQLITLQKEIAAQRAAEAAEKAAAKEAQKAAAANPPTAAVPAPENPTASDAPFAGAKVETKPDGSMLIDGKYTVKGKGTQEDPYKVTWDQLLSAQNEYAPKEGRKTIPPRIQALNDKWLEITGYVAFPLMTAESDELLSMMNQWDGCCIGVPPTPYDAVEVRLINAVSGNARLTTYGSVRGKFKVDPHLVGGWLVGLYVMDQAKLTPVSYGGIAP